MEEQVKEVERKIFSKLQEHGITINENNVIVDVRDK